VAYGSALPWLVKRHLTIDFSILRSPTVNKIITIIGPRRAGKTYFLFQVMGELVREGIDLSESVKKRQVNPRKFYLID